MRVARLRQVFHERFREFQLTYICELNFVVMTWEKIFYEAHSESDFNYFSAKP
jgi:hypothetical protein